MRNRPTQPAAVLPIELDDDQVAWLARLEKVTGTPAQVIVRSMLRDIMADDAISDTVH